MNNRMETEHGAILFLALILTLLMSSMNSVVLGQETSTANGQQTAITDGEAPTINYIINPPPNPTVQQQPPPLVLVQGGSNVTGLNPPGGQEISNPWVLAIAFVGAAAGVIYRTVYPYFERLHEMEVRGEEPVKFLRKYKFTFGISLLISVVTTMGMFSTLIPQIDTNAGLGLIFISSFVQGIGWNELTNRVSYKITDRAVDQAAAKKKLPGEEEKGQITKAPNIIGRYPIPDQSEISINSPIAATFSKPIDTSTVTKDTFTLRKDGSDVNIDAEEIRPEENLQTVIFKPMGSLEKNTKYVVAVSKEVKDQTGNKMVSDETWSFTTSTA